MIYSFLMKNWWKIQRKSSALWINYWEQCIAVNTEATPPLLWQLGDPRQQGWDCAFCQFIQCRRKHTSSRHIRLWRMLIQLLKFSQNVISFTGSTLLGTLSVCLRWALMAAIRRHSACCWNVFLSSTSHMNLSSSINISTFRLPAFHLYREQQKHRAPLWLTPGDYTNEDRGCWHHLSWSYTPRNKVSMEDK